jgi:ABC-type uncharacterized transport system permease subunit
MTPAERENSIDLRSKLILYPVLFAIFALILWYGPDSFRTTMEVVGL